MSSAEHVPDAVLPRTEASRSRLGSRSSALLFPLFAGGLVLLSAGLFFSSLRQQLFYSGVRGDPLLSFGWSAPLDDVFIHFDFARSTARGYPFQWSEGNGYSSGGTSLLYPWVLAIGYVVGFRDTALMEFAGIVACVSVLSLLLSSQRLFRNLPAWTKYLAPVLLLSVGALNWTLWSGMEVAFFLAVWGAALVAWDDLLHGEPSEVRARPTSARAAVLGFCCMLLVATRPEAAVMVFLFAASAAVIVFGEHGPRRAAKVLLWSAVPAAMVVVAHSVANRVLTGDFSAAGALVKLEINDPKLSARQVWDAWTFHVAYQVTRISGHHLAGNPYLGSVLWVVAAFPLFSRRTRRYGVLLWLSALSWVAVVALNGQVRWQNERYTMPALALLLLSAALGLGVACSHRFAGKRHSGALQALVFTAGAVFLGGLAYLQRAPFRDQVWFFGRASRNIFEQHVKAARLLREMKPRPRRIAVGDAGAIPYGSDLPALDIIGLGGYGGLPFAQATRWGIAAAVELIERMPDSERPDVLALYPSWWGDFPLWFGKRFGGVAVRGNVICGGATKVLYEADWSPLDREGRPLRNAGDVVDELDVADVVSERQHELTIEGAVGFVSMKVLPHAAEPAQPLWDAGRILPPGARATFALQGFAEGRPVTAVLRIAPSQKVKVSVTVDDGAPASIALEPSDGWIEVPFEIPAERVRPSLRFTVAAEQNETVVYHFWGLQRR